MFLFTLEWEKRLGQKKKKNPAENGDINVQMEEKFVV